MIHLHVPQDRAFTDVRRPPALRLCGFLITIELVDRQVFRAIGKRVDGSIHELCAMGRSHKPRIPMLHPPKFCFRIVPQSLLQNSAVERFFPENGHFFDGPAWIWSRLFGMKGVCKPQHTWMLLALKGRLENNRWADFLHWSAMRKATA